MNITQEQMNDNHLKLVVNVIPEDYATKLEGEIKSLSKKMNVNGFRPGKVPVGIAKKMYGNSVLAEQLDKLLNDSVLAYIREHDLKVLGQPIPYEVRQQQFDVNRLQAYDFGFELGLIPPFELPLIDGKTMDRHVLEISDEMITEEMERLRSIHGERSYPETVGLDDILYGEWKELDENGEIKDGGINATSSFNIKLVKDEVSRQLLTNLKKKESTDLSVKTAFDNNMELIIHNILKTDHHTAEHMHDRFRFSLINISHVEKAAADQDFFNKVYGEAVVHSEEEWKARVHSDLKQEYDKFANTRFERQIQDYLLAETSMNLPVDFLRKLINSNRQSDTEELNDAQIAQAMQQVKWDLIHDKLLRDNNISITPDEISARVKLDITNYYGGASAFENDPGALDRLANSLLNDEKYLARIQDQVMNDKIFEVLKSKITAVEKPVSEHEFFHH
ncbi:MAG: trigger factor [Chitinophagales bacterium]|nr:trigger factor [Chitinophagales bacterium]